MDGSARVLAICDGWPWPIRCGGQHRLAAMLQALAGLGSIDVCIVAPNPFDTAAREATQAMLPGARFFEVPLADRPRRWVESVRSRGWPWWQPWSAIDFAAIRTAMRSALGDGGYDVVWSYTTLGVPLIGGWGALVRVVDLPELHDVMIRRRSELTPGRMSLSGLRARYHAAVQARGWQRAQARACADASLVCVCSDIDREALGCPECSVVVPNGYELSPDSAGRTAVGREGGTLLFQGSMFYWPNSDAAGFFAEDVMPLIRRELPDAEFRIVGLASPSVETLDRQDGVVVVGPVERMDDELERADAVVVPLRIASGTRLKILEAWTHGLPVVSTAVGAEGLPVAQGENVLLANSASELAEACVRVLTDQALRARLATAGRALVESHFDWASIQERLITRIRDELGA